MSWYIYIVRCVDNSLYIGSTNNIAARIIKHSSKKGSKYLYSKLPIHLVYSEEYPDRSTAVKRELQLKRWTKIKKERLIRSTLFK